VRNTTPIRQRCDGAGFASWLEPLAPDWTAATMKPAEHTVKANAKMISRALLRARSRKERGVFFTFCIAAENYARAQNGRSQKAARQFRTAR
jgi:hypothetical protein